MLGAQLPAYRRSTADTVRLREVTTSEALIQIPDGSATPLTSRQESLVAVAFLPNDSARAWYEELMLEASASSVTEHPTTTAVLRKPFSLKVDGRGRVETLAAPTFPAAMNRIADLRHQFDDFFLRLPSTPLRPGLTWSDTLARQDSTPGGGYSRTSSVARYRVERDTVVQGTPGLVVAMTQQVKLVTGGPIEGQPVTAESVLSGTDTGLFVFSPKEGRLLGRARTGDLTGNVTLKGGPKQVVLPQTYKYRSTLEPAGKSAAALSIGNALRRFAIPSTSLGASCTGVVGSGKPLLVAGSDPKGWREIYGVLVGYFGREEMMAAEDVEWMSSANYTVGGADKPVPQVVAVQFRDSTRAAAAQQQLVRRAVGKPWEVRRRDEILTIVNAPAALAPACRTEISGRVARELER